jgi:hypothetical protein
MYVASPDPGFRGLAATAARARTTNFEYRNSYIYIILRIWLFAKTPLHEAGIRSIFVVRLQSPACMRAHNRSSAGS